MRTSNSQKLWRITLEFSNTVTHTVTVKASTYEVACRRALKRYPSATGVKTPS